MRKPGEWTWAPFVERLHDVWLELDRVRHELAAAARQVTDHGTVHVEPADEAEVAVRAHDYLRAYA